MSESGGPSSLRPAHEAEEAAAAGGTAPVSDGTTAAEREDPVERESLRVTVSARSGVWIVLGALALFVGAAFLATTVRALTVIGVGTLLAFAVEPVVLGVQRRFGCRRAPAVAIVGAGLLLAFSVIAVLVGPAAVRQAQKFGDELPETLEQFEDLPVVGPRFERADMANDIEDWIDRLPGRLDATGVEDAARSVLNVVLDALGVLLVALVILLDGPRLVGRLRVLVPVRHRPRADEIGRVFYVVVGRYFAGSLLVAMIGGTWVLVVGLVMGVPLAPVAAVWYAVVSLIPQIGGFLGTSFVTLLALTQGLVPGLVVLVLVVAYMNIENYFISPAIVGDAVDLSPPVTMLAALVGGAVAGVPGALVATPLCGTVKALYRRARFGTLPDPPRRLRDRIEIPDPLRRLGRRTGSR